MLGKQKFDKLFWVGVSLASLFFYLNRVSVFDNFFAEIFGVGYRNERSKKMAKFTQLNFF